jgi:phosphohistidine swiveling domain-containing protein
MENIIVKKISSIKWINRWAGSYTFISCSYWGPQYYHSLKKYLGPYFEHTLFVHRKGTVSFFIAEDEFRKLGKTLAVKSEKDMSFVKKYCNGLKENTDILLPLMEKLQKKIPTMAEYKKFHLSFDRHLAFHVFVKKAIDFLSTEGLKRLEPYFRDARLYSEKIYSESERFFRSITKLIAEKEGRNADYLTCLTQQEFEGYLRNGKLPDDAELKNRYEASVLYFEKDKLSLLFGESVDEVETIIANQSSIAEKEIKGISAYPGKVTGKVRIISDPLKIQVFNDNDILVTGMTRPEFMSVIKKASAIITDVGGILCHAAITAREMKIPCVVGTAVATKVLKDGDIVEVDASNGTIKIVK